MISNSKYIKYIILNRRKSVSPDKQQVVAKRNIVWACAKTGEVWGLNLGSKHPHILHFGGFQVLIIF